MGVGGGEGEGEGGGVKRERERERAHTHTHTHKHNGGSWLYVIHFSAFSDACILLLISVHFLIPRQTRKFQRMFPLRPITLRLA
jgi:hypothetical protein